MTAPSRDYDYTPAAAALHKLAYHHTNQFRAAFRRRCEQSEDEILWGLLAEDTEAALAARQGGGLDAIPALTLAGAGFTGQVEDALERADPSYRRSSAFTGAADQLRLESGVWPRQLPPAVAAHARYSALVWLGLWHLVSAGVSPQAAEHCLGAMGRRTPAPSHPPAPQRATSAPEPASLSPTAASHRAEPAPAPEPAKPAPATPSERSVLAGTLELKAANVWQSTFGTAFGLAVSAFFGAIVFCLVAAMFWGMVNPFAAVTWLASMPIAVIAAILWGLVVADLTFRGASRAVIEDMGVTFLPENHPLSQQLREMCARIRFGTVPALGVYPSADINGFAVGAASRSPVIAFSSGALERLTPGEQSALLAHELGHIAANDSAKLIYAQCFQRSLVWWMLISPIKTLGRWLFSTLGEMMILGLSRSREYRADAFGAAVAGPSNMIALLETLGTERGRPPATARVAPELFIRSTGTRWFKTHPALEDRITALRKKRYYSELGARHHDPQPAKP